VSVHSGSHHIAMAQDVPTHTSSHNEEDVPHGQHGQLGTWSANGSGSGSGPCCYYATGVAHNAAYLGN